jgi:hypothetical protein
MSVLKNQKPTAAGIKSFMFGLFVEASTDKCNINNFYFIYIYIIIG